MWNKESLLKSETLTVKVCGDDVVIRKLKAGEVFKYNKDAEDGTFKMVVAALVEPALTLEEVKSMPIDTYNLLLIEISKFLGTDKEAKQGN